MKILFTGGGTGGHITPVLAVAEEIRKTNNNYAKNKDIKDKQTNFNIAQSKNIGVAGEKLEFIFIGPESDFNKAISDAGIEVKTIKAGKLRRYFSLENFTDIFKIIFGGIQSLCIVYKFKPDAVFSKGGFASIPPIIAARILRIPIFSHESDIVPGLANKIISRFADKIFISFEETGKYFPNKNIIFSGSPVREDISAGDKNKAREFFNLKEDIPTILVFGGSQGARKINEVILKSLPAILEKYQVIHICGMKNYKEIKHMPGKKELSSKASELSSFLPLADKRYKLYPYLSDNLKDAFALCDIIISRAGANSLFEIITLNKPSIIIPLPTSANNHQFYNAEFFAKKGMIILIKEENLAGDLIKELSKLSRENNYKNDMIKKMKEYNCCGKNAAKIIAEEIINIKSNQ